MFVRILQRVTHVAYVLLTLLTCYSRCLRVTHVAYVLLTLLTWPVLEPRPALLCVWHE
jgi:hypothetical protein